MKNRNFIILVICLVIAVAFGLYLFFQARTERVEKVLGSITVYADNSATFVYLYDADKDPKENIHFGQGSFEIQNLPAKNYYLTASSPSEYACQYAGQTFYLEPGEDKVLNINLIESEECYDPGKYQT